MRFGPHDTAAGSDISTPPSDSQPLQLPSNHLCHSALSVPRTNTSRRFDPHEATAGPDISTPPSDSQPLQLPSNHLCHSALSVPRTKRSSRFGPHDTASGSDVNVPPRDPQPLQPLLSMACHTPLSVPRANTSRRSGASEATPGPDVSTPPRDSQALQLMPGPPSSLAASRPAPPAAPARSCRPSASCAERAHPESLRSRSQHISVQLHIATASGAAETNRSSPCVSAAHGGPGHCLGAPDDQVRRPPVAALSGGHMVSGRRDSPQGITAACCPGPAGYGSPRSCH